MSCRPLLVLASPRAPRLISPCRRLFTRLLLTAHVFCLLCVLSGMTAAAPDHESQVRWGAAALSGGGSCKKGRVGLVSARSAAPHHSHLPSQSMQCFCVHYPPSLPPHTQYMDQLLKELAGSGGAGAGASPAGSQRAAG